MFNYLVGVIHKINIRPVVILYLHPRSCKLNIFSMTVYIHESQSKILIFNGSRSTDVDTSKYQQQNSNDLLLPTILNQMNIHDSSIKHQKIYSSGKENCQKMYLKLLGSVKHLRIRKGSFKS